MAFLQISKIIFFFISASPLPRRECHVIPLLLKTPSVLVKERTSGIEKLVILIVVVVSNCKFVPIDGYFFR